MFRGVGVLILSLGLMIVFAGPASAQPWWCEDDPILHFSGGTSVHLTTSFSRAALSPSTRVTYDVHVPAGTTVTVTKPASGQVPSDVKVMADGAPGSAAITVSVSGGTFDITVTQTGAGAGKQTHPGSSSGTPFTVTLGG